jgi:hypothetical protein
VEIIFDRHTAAGWPTVDRTQILDAALVGLQLGDDVKDFRSLDRLTPPVWSSSSRWRPSQDLALKYLLAAMNIRASGSRGIA